MDIKSKVIDGTKQLLQGFSFVIYILFALSMFTTSLISALLFTVAGILFLPKTQQKLKDTPLNDPKRIGYTILGLTIFALSLQGLSALDYAPKQFAEQLAQTQQEQENRHQEAKTAFKENSEEFIADLQSRLDSKNYQGVINRANLISDLNNEEINRLRQKALKELNTLETKYRKKEEEAQYVRSWNVYKGNSQMDDSRSISVQKGAKNTARGWLKTIQPTLIIRCLENKTNVIFNIGTSFTPVYGEYNKAKIRYRIDEKKSVTQYWSESTDNNAAFAPRSISLVRALKNSKRLRIEFNPFNADPAVAEFDMRGVKPHLEDVSKTCNWKL